MKKNIKVKFMIIIFIAIILFNTSSTFAFSLKNSNLTKKIITNEIAKNNSSSFTNKIKNLFKRSPNILKGLAASSEKQSIDLLARKESISRVKEFKIPYFNSLSKIGKYSMVNSDYAKLLLGRYLTSSSDVALVSDILTSIDELNVDANKISLAISQFLKALRYTTSAMPNEQESQIIAAKKHQYYHPDLDANGNVVSNSTEVTYTSIQDMARFCNYVGTKPIGIGKVKLHTVDTINNTSEDINDVYYVALAGTQFKEGQSCGLIADVLSGIETNSPYLKNATKAITENIPKGSKIMLSGFSLGGMIAQQLLVNEEILTNYEIVQVTLLGCPALCVDERKELFEKYNLNIPINRVIDEYDIVPFLCIDWFLDQEPQEIIENLYKEDHNYTKLYRTFLGTHLIGYMEQDCYKKYDILGNPNTNGKYTTMTLKHGDFKYFDAPTEFTQGYYSRYE